MDGQVMWIMQQLDCWHKMGAHKTQVQRFWEKMLHLGFERALLLMRATNAVQLTQPLDVIEPSNNTLVGQFVLNLLRAIGAAPALMRSLHCDH